MKTGLALHTYLSEGPFADDLERVEVVDAEPRPLEPQELGLLGGVRHALLLLLRLGDARLGAKRLLEALQSARGRKGNMWVKKHLCWTIFGKFLP